MAIQSHGATSFAKRFFPQATEAPAAPAEAEVSLESGQSYE